MKRMQVELWWVWLYGLILIGVSLYSTKKLPSLNGQQFDHDDSMGSANEKITIFSAPVPFVGPYKQSQSLAIRSWLSLSPQIVVVLFAQHPSVATFASAFPSRVMVDSHIDFTFLGTPFFHSMIERSRAFTTDITVFIDSQTVVLPDLISTLNYAYKLDRDWLLVASMRNVTHFPFHLDDSGQHWIRDDNGKLIRTQELQDLFGRNWRWDHCKDGMIMAWNSRNLPLHNGVLPPFLYGEGIHNHWLVNEAVLSELRFVFDASWAITSFSLTSPEDFSNQLVQNRSWECAGNSLLAGQYGSMVVNEIDYSSVVKLLRWDKRYLFIDIKEDNVNPTEYQKLSMWDQNIFHFWMKKNYMTCISNIKSQNGISDCYQKDLLVSSPLLDFPFSMESLLSVTADENKTVVLAVSGYSYKDMLMSWVCRLRHLLVTNFLICALDVETYHFAVLQGLPVFYDTTAPSNISFNDCHFGTKCFQRVTKVKSRMVLKIVKLGYNVLLSDVDVHWFQNPLPMLYSFGPGVLAAQSDEYNRRGPINLPRRLNSGFYFARSDGQTIAALEKVVKHAATSNLSEQPSFYDTLCGEGGSYRISEDQCMEPETNLTVHFLDRNLFPNGAYLDLWQKKNVKAACKKKGCLVLHNNWISGRAKKLERQVLSGLTRGSTKGSSNKPGTGGTSVSLDMCIQSKDIFVRVVHAGGREELYPYAVSASKLMEKYPGTCVARQEVFKNPQESILWPEENLLPGHKYLIIPSSTAKKLRRKHMEKGKVKGSVQSKDDSFDVNITWDESGDLSEESVCSAKDFYAFKNKSASRLPVRSIRPKKHFVPPLPMVRTSRGFGWEPSLTSVQEVSP